MSFKSPLGRVRHLGSAKDGTHHWWMQRVTALALVPLGVWFAAALVAGVSSDYESAHAWIANPFVGGLLLILVVATFYHAALGLQVVIEDYIHNEGAKIASLLIMKAACLVLGLAAVLAVLNVLLGDPH